MSTSQGQRVDAAPQSRRDRLRAATEQEIRQSARRLLVRDGLGAVSMRAVADEMGMTSPALYRYYASHEDVLEALIIDCFDELIAALVAARTDDDPGAQLIATGRAFRRWALDHPAEFSLVFGHPVPNLSHGPDGPIEACGMRLGQTFAEVFVGVWHTYRFPLPDDAAIDPIVAQQLRPHMELLPALPMGALHVFVTCWSRLIGMVSAEVFGQLGWAVEHTEPFFEEMLAETAARLQMPRSLLGEGPRPQGP
ncbi:MAG: TetR/AcrR family transcriptional regulator [Ornithinimicrobium sp.]